MSISEGLKYFMLGPRAEGFAELYWLNDLVLHAFIILIIGSLVRSALPASVKSRAISMLLSLFAVAVGLISLYFYYDAQLSRWMTPVSRNLSFAEEMLVFLLWAILVRARTQDQVLLLVSSGLGIQVTGEVIAHTLRMYSKSREVWLPNVLLNAADLLCLLIWLWAFRTGRAIAAIEPAPPAPVNHNTI
ncbi:MAG TPA: hypothetical protein VKU01_08095 [Bryobacteraceae bacterium]|nr:hypothetical protein [Bryobacteraceae bacterium]